MFLFKLLIELLIKLWSDFQSDSIFIPYLIKYLYETIWLWWDQSLCNFWSCHQLLDLNCKWLKNCYFSHLQSIHATYRRWRNFGKLENSNTSIFSDNNIYRVLRDLDRGFEKSAILIYWHNFANFKVCYLDVLYSCEWTLFVWLYANFTVDFHTTSLYLTVSLAVVRFTVMQQTGAASMLNR